MIQLHHVLHDLNDNQCRVMQFIGDKLKRSQVKCTMGHSS